MTSPLYINGRYCFSIAGLVKCLKTFPSPDDKGDANRTFDRLCYWLEPLVADGFFVRWLQCQNDNLANETIALTKKKRNNTPNRIVQAILLQYEIDWFLEVNKV